mmetsp:Transcript_56100/g.50461  ORF Transcript_56100/g.50461 Transcript_56100/m.50461 type:complete len:146 (+) Transcript_56100:2-439(+)
MSKVDLIEFSKNHSFKVVLCCLALSLLANLGRYDFNICISFVTVIFFDHIIINYTLLLSLVLLVSCILDIVWLSIEGPISHHYEHIPELEKLATFSFVISIFSLFFKILLILCVISRANSGQYSQCTQSVTKNREFEDNDIDDVA